MIMEIDSMPFLLVTANVGSVFEDPSRLLQAWIKEFLTRVKLLKPQFLGLHLQEVGGKTYEKSMEYVQEFIKQLCESEELSEYNRIRVYLDEDYNSAEHFTALGNLYFVHQTIQTVRIWNFLSHEWETVDGKNIHTGNIEAVSTKEKSKFPQHFFPECKWSRKGFLRTRWELNCTVIDFVNIHLFHDASNLAACEEFPSVYCKSRRRALVHTLEKFHTDSKNGVAPYFIFGDFNFRCDTEGVIKKLTEDLTVHRVQNIKSDSTKVHYRNPDGNNVLTVGKKEFNHVQHQTKFKESWLQQFDRELEPLREVLVEYPITFPPSYPYEEEPDMPKNYMSTRCPAWCDRIVISPTARDLIVDDAFSSTDYNIIGEDTCMGDHKPVYLSVHMKTFQGIVRCCLCNEHVSQSESLSSDLDIMNVKYINDKLQAYCLYTSEEYCKILLDCCNLDKLIGKNLLIRDKKMLRNDNNNDNNENFTTNDDNQQHEERQPLVSINVIDTDNYNVCMCSILTDIKKSNNYITNLNHKDNIINLDGSICPECCNIIKKQTTEHRCTLISKRLMLANNIIVNRIDTHYLTTHIDGRQEPYTPESAESHSPCPEFELLNTCSQHDDKDIRKTTITNNNNTLQLITNDNNINNKTSEIRGIVSPRQLKSRLEHLQRTSLNNIDLVNDEIEYKNFKPKKRCCDFSCCNIL